MENCVFCKISKSELPSEKIWEDENFFAFLDLNPVNPGHILLIPKKHTDYLFDIEDPLYSKLFKVAKKLAKPLKQAMQSKRIGIAVEGFGVPHAHVHLIPINKGFELDPNRAKKAMPKELKDVANKIKQFIKT
jgi:histidine triad (HIT) family protein